MTRDIAVIALSAGIVGELLLRSGEIGVNVTLYLLVLIIGVVRLSSRRLSATSRHQREPLVAATLFALLAMVRDAPMLAAWNVAASLGALALAGWMAAPDALPALPALDRLTVVPLLRSAVRLLPDAATGGFAFIRHDVHLVRSTHARHFFVAQRLVRALIVAALVGSVFAALLSAGDAVFAHAASGLVGWNVREVLLHVVWTAVCGWPVLGWLRSWTAVRGTASAFAPRAPRVSLGRLDASAVLAGMTLIFSLFVAVQVRLLFGGQAYVQAVTGLTLAEYARTGFFTLVATAGLVLAVLLTLDAALESGSLAASNAHRRLSHALVAMVVLMLVSAIERMQLYIGTFGLSLDRLYAMVAMCWIAVALAAFAGTVLRRRPHRFVAMAVRSAWITLIVVNVANPERLVVRVNAARWSAGARFDVAYHSNLSADAVPELARQLATMQNARRDDAAESCEASQRLMARFGATATSRWGAWTVGRRAAQDAMRRAEASGSVQRCSPLH